MRIIEKKGLLIISRRLDEGYARPSDEAEAEETIGMILGDLDRITSTTKRRRLLKLAMGYMKMYGLDKDREWMAQYNMRKNAKPRQESIAEGAQGYCAKYEVMVDADHTCDGWVSKVEEGKAPPNYRKADGSQTCGNCKAFQTKR